MLPVVKRAAKEVGSLAKLAKALKIRPQAFYRWKQVPSDRVIAIEVATGGKIGRREMRPDLYPPERSVA